MREGYKDEIEENSLEWTNVAYRLQTMTGKSSLKMVKIFKYPQKVNTSKFNSNDKIDAVVDVTDFKMEYRTKIINHAIPLQDVIFFCGHINIKKYHSEPSKIFTFLLCQVNLGKIGKFTDPTNKVDSVFIPPENESQPYHFNFLLNDYSQYNVKYQVSFVISDDHDIRNKQTICSICQQNLATIYCRDQKMHFCDNCSNRHHMEIKIAQQNEIRKRSNSINSQNYKKPNPNQQIPPHQLEKLNRINSLPICEQHSIKYEYFCLKCQRYVCNICIQKGTHNQNPDHVIKHIQYLYQEKQEVNNTASTRIKHKLEKLLESIEELSNSITSNYQQVKKRLCEEFQMALQKLEKAYFDKISKVYSDQIELNMTYQKIEWTKAFILHQEKHLKPINYFKLQARYESEINSTRINGYEESFSIKPDLAYYIDWKVGTLQECAAQRGKNTHRSQEAPNQNIPTNSQVQSNVNPNNSSESILKFDSKSEAPKRGQLSLLLQKSNLHFFKFKTVDKPLIRD